MSADSVTPPSAWPPRRLARWAGIFVALVVAGWAAWYFGIELPDRKEAAEAAALRRRQRPDDPDLNLDLVWIAPGSIPDGDAGAKSHREVVLPRTGKADQAAESGSRKR